MTYTSQTTNMLIGAVAALRQLGCGVGGYHWASEPNSKFIDPGSPGVSER